MYGLRGCEPCVSCMGLGLLKEFKIFESMLENQNYHHFSQTVWSKFSTSTKLVEYYYSN